MTMCMPKKRHKDACKNCHLKRECFFENCDKFEEGD